MKKLFTTGTTLLIGFLLLCCSLPMQAQDFSYTPKNPAFGGNTFNYNWLLNGAQAQNGFEDPDAVTRDRRTRDPLEDFKNSLNRQILSQISRRVIGEQFGTGGDIQEGTFTVGDFTIDVSQSINGLLITIIDLTSGNQSVIEVPNP